MTYDELLRWAGKRDLWLLAQEWRGGYYLAVVTAPPEAVAKINGVRLMAYDYPTIEAAAAEVTRLIEGLDRFVDRGILE